MTKDPLMVLDAIYTFAPDNDAWLDGIVRALEPYDLGGGIGAYTSNLGPDLAVTAVANYTRYPTSTIHAMAEHLPPAFYRRMHAPMPLSFSHDEIHRWASDLGVDSTNWAAPVPGFTPPPAAWAVIGGDANVETTTLAFHCGGSKTTFSKRDGEMLEYIAAHLGSALRLRSVLGRLPSPDDDAVEAVISTEGALLDARHSELETTAPLLEAVRRSEKTKLRRATAEERIEVWTALVEGRWSILERTDSDGKRFMLACRNDPRTSSLRLLTSRERSVVAYAAVGHSFKYIAYELGIPLSTTAVILETAMRKLGIQSREELIRMFARNYSEPPPANRTTSS